MSSVSSRKTLLPRPKITGTLGRGNPQAPRLVASTAQRS
jgi:hypothetical protein